MMKEITEEDVSDFLLHHNGIVPNLEHHPKQFMFMFNTFLYWKERNSKSVVVNE